STRSGERALARLGRSPLTWFFVRTFAPRPLLFRLFRTLPVIAPRWPVPAANRIYIDAVRAVSVTRETLSRYTGKSSVVNILIVENLWETFGGFRHWLPNGALTPVYGSEAPLGLARWGLLQFPAGHRQARARLACGKGLPGSSLLLPRSLPALLR